MVDLLTNNLAPDVSLIGQRHNRINTALLVFIYLKYVFNTIFSNF